MEDEAIKLTKHKVKAGNLIPVLNKQTEHLKEDRCWVVVWVEDVEGEEFCLLFTERDIQKAKARAQENPEDIPKKSFLTDLLD